MTWNDSKEERKYNNNKNILQNKPKCMINDMQTIAKNERRKKTIKKIIC